MLDVPQSEFVSSAGTRRNIKTELLETARIEPGLFWAKISFQLEQRRVTLAGLTNKRAAELTQTVSLLIEQELQREYQALSAHILALERALKALLDRGKYIRGYDIRHLLGTEKTNIAHLPRFQELLKLRPFQTNAYTKIRKQVDDIAEMVQPPHKGIELWNEVFVRKEKEDPYWINFFENVEKSALNCEQRDAVVVHEDRNRLVAAAGSGKSSTLVAKAGYAIKRGYVEPHEVLALAFNAKAAAEIRERLADRLHIDITAQTFHSLGKKIVESVDGKKRVEKGTAQILQKVVTELTANDPEFLSAWLHFKAVHWEAEPEREFASVDEYEAYIKTKGEKHKDREEWGIPSLQGEPVKSFEELAIANWLFVHGVRYTYEPPYEHDVAELGWKKYEPDFVYELDDGTRLYHEHFALRADQTSPFGAAYVRLASNKRKLHAEFGTSLFETTSAQFKSGTVFTHLRKALESRGVAFNQKSPDELKECLKERNDRDLIKLIQALILHAKESGYGESHFLEKAPSLRDLVRTNAFLALLFPVWRAYTQRLLDIQSIDFADMIGRAADYVEADRYPSPAKLILVDEFQDISPGRARLVNALLAKHPDSVLFGVGDDWQAINRFAGSDLSIMREFSTHFGKTETRRLNETFRSNQGISNVSATFVMENDRQIPKTVKAKVKDNVGVIRIVEYTSNAMLTAGISAKLNELAELSDERNKLISVLIIGRYQYDTTKVVSETDIDRWNELYKGRIVRRQLEIPVATIRFAG